MKLTKPSLTKQNLWKWVVGLLVLGVVAYVGAIINEKRQFSQAEIFINEQYSAIINSVNEPQDTVETKSCTYSNAKFSKGSLSCGIGREFIYEDISNEKANEYVMKITQTLGLGKTKNTSSQSRDSDILFLKPQEYDSRKIDQTLSQSLPSTSGFICSLNYIFPVWSKSYKLSVESPGENLYVIIRCSKSEPILEHFPIMDY